MTVFLLLSIMASEADMFLDFSALARPLASAAFIQEFDHPENTVDILHYDIELEVLEDIQEIEGVTTILFQGGISPVSEIRLDLRQLTVDSIWDSSGSLSFDQEDDSVS